MELFEDIESQYIAGLLLEEPAGNVVMIHSSYNKTADTFDYHSSYSITGLRDISADQMLSRAIHDASGGAHWEDHSALAVALRAENEFFVSHSRVVLIADSWWTNAWVCCGVSLCRGGGVAVLR